jgi:hypothetical protein
METLVTQPVRRSSSSRSLIARLIDQPELGPRLRALPAPAFARLVQEVGVEDAGELVALATTEQLVRAFDEDLFRNERPGEREALDVRRFATWLEVLLEAGDGVAAARVAELSEDFVAHALSALLVVLDFESLRSSMEGGGDDADRVEKAIESALSEEIDGYLLIAREPDGWDAALTLVLALDRDHRELLVRLLDRCAAVSADLCEDLDALSEVLSEGASLAEDVEAEREARRGREGYVEPRAAKNFLTLARTGKGGGARDPVTRAYFREVAPKPAHSERPLPEGAAKLLAAIERLAAERPTGAARGRASAKKAALPTATNPLLDALRALREVDAPAFDARSEELAFLANVLLAAGSVEGRALRPAEAAEAALATVALGAALEKIALGETTADALFRAASARLAASGEDRYACGYLRAHEDVAAALLALGKPRKTRPKT